MDVLTNWDDLLHGTIVFAALVPFLAAGFVAWFWPERLWLALACGVGGAMAWLFGWPAVPPGSSDDAMVPALLAGILVVGLGGVGRVRWWRWVIGAGVWFGMAWLLYPAWLEAEGGSGRKVLVGAGVTATVLVLGRVAGWGLDRGAPSRAPGWILVAPAIGLAALLQMGGSTQFTQTAGALAAALVGVLCVAWKRGERVPGGVGELWGMVFGMLAWSGWLFAEVSVVAVCVVCGGAVAATAVGRWSGAAVSLLLAAVAVWMGWMAYGGGSEGY